MNQDNRVLGRMRARELTAGETKAVSGALATQTVCTFDGRTADGDASIGEC